jgi:hypothetical protein
MAVTPSAGTGTELTLAAAAQFLQVAHESRQGWVPAFQRQAALKAGCCHDLNFNSGRHNVVTSYNQHTPTVLKQSTDRLVTNISRATPTIRPQQPNWWHMGFQ